MKIISISVFVILTVYIIYSKSIRQDSIPSFGYGYVSSLLKNAKGEIPNFSFLDNNGKFHELYRYGDVEAVVFLSENANCPLSEIDKQRYLTLIEKFKGKKVEFFILDSSAMENRNTKNNDIVSLMDTTQMFTNYLQIKSSKKIAVLSTDNWSVRYQGVFDSDNKNIIEAITKTIDKEDYKIIENGEGPCGVNFNIENKVHNVDYVAEIIKKKCLSCHGEMSPYLPKLNTGEKLEKWREMAKETILTERMPPFGVDRFYENFEEELSLNNDEKRALINWFEDKNRPKINDKKLEISRNISDPYKDLIKVYSVKMDSPLKISPGGTLEYIYTQLGEAAPRDMWIRAIEYKSITTKQIHHAAIQITSKPLTFYEGKVKQYMETEGKRKEIFENLIDGNKFPFILFAINKYEITYNANFSRLQISAAGKKQPVVYNPNTYVFIPKGSYVILESHFMGTGKKEEELATIDFYEDKIKNKKIKQLKGRMLYSFKIKIPPNNENYVVNTSIWKVPKNIKLLNTLSHMHMRGKAIRITKTAPNGEEKIILSIPNYYYGWNVGAEVTYKIPLDIEAGSIIKAQCIFDNSLRNPSNPEPEREVLWGQRLDRSEMCNIGLGYYFN